MDKLLSKLTYMTLLFSLVLGMYLILTPPSAHAIPTLNCANCISTCGSKWKFWNWVSCTACGGSFDSCGCISNSSGCVAACEDRWGNNTVIDVDCCSRPC